MSEKDQHEFTRRTALKALGISGIGGGGLISSSATQRAQAATISTYEGTRSRTYTPDSSGDYWKFDSTFSSSALQDDYGRDYTVPAEGIVPRSSIPDQYKNPDSEFQVDNDASAKIATGQEMSSAEEEERPSNYSGPLYVYTAEKMPPSSDDLCERTGPINVGWTFDNANSIKDTMKQGGWGSWWADLSYGVKESNRYVTYIDSSGNKVTKKQDEHIGKTIKDLAGPINQWHIRAYDIDTNDDIKVVGQVHHDPWDHGKWPIKEIDVIPGVEYKTPDWSFSEGRRLVSDEWKSWGSDTSVLDLGNGSHWKSSDGKFEKINRP